MELSAAIENGNIIAPNKIPPPLEMYTAADLVKMDLRPPRFFINGLLPAGVAISA